MKKPKPAYNPSPKTAEGQAEWKRVVELALLRGWVAKTQTREITTAPRGKGLQWGWGK